MDVGRNLVDSASDLVPSSVPRPVAKGGVAVAGVLIVFWLMQKVTAPEEWDCGVWQHDSGS